MLGEMFETETSARHIFSPHEAERPMSAHAR
jgi:hypothetical protein